MFTLMHRNKKLLPAVVLILLIGAGFAANIFKLTLFFNVDLIFGSFFVMLVISLYGPVWGTVAGAAAASYTYILWNHPYAIIIFTCEALAVGIFYSRKKANLVFLDVLYWFIIGMPLVYLFYHGVMKMDNTGSVLIMFKQAVNGILNALLARIVLMFAGDKVAKLHPPVWSGKWQFTNILFDTIIGFVILPSLVFITLSGWFELNDIEQEIRANVVAKGRSASHAVNSWIEEARIQTETLSRSIEEAVKSEERDARIQQIGDQFISGRPEIIELHITDGGGATVYRLQSGNTELDMERTIDLSISEGTGIEITALKKPLSPAFNNLLLFKTHYQYPVESGSSTAGTGSVLLVKKTDIIRGLIEDMLSGNKSDILVLDRNGNVVINTGDDTSHYVELVADIEQDPMKKADSESDVLRWIPPKMRNISVMERWEKAVYVFETNVEQATGWKIYSIASIAPYQNRIYYTSLWKLSIIIVVILISAVLSRIIADRYVRPIRTLQTITTDLPEKLDKEESPEWPKTKISEISGLVVNFRHTTAMLNKAFTGLRTTNKELSEQKEKAEAANRAKSRFLANMSHDIRTPLTAIKSMVELLLDDTKLHVDLRDDMETIQKSTEVLLSILNSILDLSRIEAGRLSIEEKNFEIHTLIERIVRLFTVSAKAKGIDFSYSIDSDVPFRVRGDSLRIEQVLLNLIGNALKFTEKGWISLEVKRDRELPLRPAPGETVPITFYVRDTGIGIPRDKASVIFESFSQADSSITRSYGGSGLGLTISRELVTLMKGTLSFTSTPGEGSLFFFTLPLKTAAEEIGGQSSADRESREKQKNSRAYSILVADDEAINRTVAKKILGGEGHSVTTVANGEGAIETLKETAFDLLFLDIYMPGLGGIETARRIRGGEASRKNREIPIIGLSGSSEEDVVEDCKHAGMNEVVLKPLSREKAEHVIAQFIRD